MQPKRYTPWIDVICAGIATVMAAGCAVGTSAGARSATGQCSATPPDNARLFSVADAGRLAGTYTLVLVNTEPHWPREPRSARMHLFVPDSAFAHAFWAARQARPRELPLVGWVERIPGDTAAFPEVDEATSRSPERPGVVFYKPFNWLRLGSNEPLLTDQSGTSLVTTHVFDRGFWGTWQRDEGIAIIVDTLTDRVIPWPRGYFCALR